MLFDATVRRELAKGFGATLVVILTIVLTMFLIRTVGQAAGGAVSPQDVVLLLGYVALQHLPTMLSLSLFVAIVVGMGRMYRDSEMAVWFSSGVGLRRFVRPVLRMSWAVLLVVALLLFFVWPWCHRNSLELRERYEQRSDLSRVAPGVFQASRDGKRVFFIERDGTEGTSGAEARNVFILSNTPRAESVTSAKKGRLLVEGNDRFLVLEKGQRSDTAAATGEHTLFGFETYRLLAGETVSSTGQNLPPRAVRTIDLVRNPTARGQGELTWRLGMTLAACNLLLLGVGLSATNPRRASNWNLLFALLAFMLYYNLVNLSQSWVAGGRLSMATAVVVLHGGALAIGLAHLWWREHATTVNWGLGAGGLTHKPKPQARSN